MALAIGAVFLHGSHAYAATNLYYSVGQSTSTNLMTGSPTVTITGGAAVFSIAQTGNIGVGDKVTYNTSAIAYISGKSDTSQLDWSLETATGSAPANITGATVVSITRAYASLASAFSGFTDSNHLATTSLVGANVIVNIPCYYDTGPDITDAVMSTAITTGPSNYLNVFTPNNTSTQANFSQRHNGTWTSTGAYSLVVSGGIAAFDDRTGNYMHVTGLQMELISSSSFQRVLRTDAMTGSGGSVVIDSNIVQAQISGSSNNDDGIGGGSPAATPTIFIMNNIVYGLNGTSSDIGMAVQSGTYYLYNNTAYNNYTSYAGGGGTHTTFISLKNNIAQDDTVGYTNTGVSLTVDASSTNNLSDHSDATGTLPQNAKTVIFLSTSTNDFHLSPFDASARGAGANLTSDPNNPFNYDIDGQTRPTSTAWDIGADEYIQTDITPPTVTSFILPSNATSTVVPVTSFTATDDTAVADYLITLSSTTPSRANASWTASAPTSFTFGGNGTTTVYAWAMDTSGNISSNASQTVSIITPFENVYYSIGQSTTTNLETGSSTITLTSGAAVFSIAQTGNIGVGDQVVYGPSSTIAYISGKTNANDLDWNLVTARGGTPQDISGATVLGIHRAYVSLKAAVTGMTDSNHVNNSNLVLANVAVNLPCYYDSGPDTTSVILASTTITGLSNYLNIFTPNNTSTQANFSQRHQGVWTSSGAYSLVVSGGGAALDIRTNYTRITGLQIELVSSSSFQRVLRTDSMPGSGGSVVLESNIVQAQISGSSNSDDGIGGGSPAATPTVFILNNIVYGLNGTSSDIGIAVASGTYYLYNNTAYNNYTSYAWGGSGHTTSVSLKNDIAQDDTAGYTNGAGTNNVDASSTNNLSDHGDAPGASAQSSITLQFASTTGSNFHLSAIDNNAIGHGANLTNDPNRAFTHDIDGQVRPSSGAWDIGADEYVPVVASPPTITSFTMPSTSNTLAVSISSFTATSTVNPIAGYLITQSPTVPLSSNPNWSASVPTTFTFSGSGALTAYAWVTDAYGNISLSTSASVVVTQSSLTVSYIVTPTNPGIQIPSNFMGVSYEQQSSVQTNLFGVSGDTDPIYIQLAKNLLAYGSGPLNIRLGGNSTDSTGAPASSTYTQLAGIANAVNVQFEVGVNLGSNNIPLAVSQAQAIAAQVPSGSLSAIEIGNEPDLYATNGDRPGYTFSQYFTDFTNWSTAISPDLPSGLKFMGPGWAFASSLPNLPTFLADESSSLSMVSQHWYAGSYSTSSPNPSDFLLSDSAVSSEALAVASSVTLAHAAGLPFRMGEINSISTNGGEPGISNAFGSALWTADTLFNFANVGVDGVNFHGSTNGNTYAPFVLNSYGSAPSMDFSIESINPEYYGMLFFQQATQNSAKLIPVASTTASIPHFDAWATVDAAGTVRVVLINRNETTQGTINIDLPGSYGSGSLTQLLAPSYQSLNGVTLGGQTFDGSNDGTIQGTQSLATVIPSNNIYSVTIPETSAAILTIPPVGATIVVSSGGGSSGGGGGGGGGYIPPTTTTTPTSTTGPLPTSTAGLQELLASLQATLNTLIGQATAQGITIPGITSSSNPYLFTRNLTIGSTGSDVTALQHYLNTHGFPLAALPGYAGSLGYETRYFGVKTQEALAKFQKSVGIVPPVGYFGPITRGWINGHSQ